VHCWCVLMTTASGHPAAVANVPAAVIHISHVNLPFIDTGVDTASAAATMKHSLPYADG
jgi:hypothetical protein